MVETAAHQTDHVFPRRSVRQWVLSVPKQLRNFMQRDGDGDTSATAASACAARLIT
jgi:hypothetical protein